MNSTENSDPVRIKAKIQKSSGQEEYRQFSIDPKVTDSKILHNIIVKAFDLQRPFTLYYVSTDIFGIKTKIPLFSDWDLKAAIINASTPFLKIVVNAEDVIYEESVKEGWNVIQSKVVSYGHALLSRDQLCKPIPNIFMETLSKVQKVFTSKSKNPKCSSLRDAPLNDEEFHSFLDSVGQVVNSEALRLRIFCGGIIPSLRKVVWKHILHVYPKGMQGKERTAYIKRKVQEYNKLKQNWKSITDPTLQQHVYCLSNMVYKDVRRTDRHHPFYSGSDDNKNLLALCNVLTTFALNHPSVSYCQGMSDFVSPIMVVMMEEATTYICFCALMERVKHNFMIDGCAMLKKFQDLTLALIFYDPEFYMYLKSHEVANDFFFSYRWLLLEMKREFSFEDSLLMMEVMWSSIGKFDRDDELQLYEIQFSDNNLGRQTIFKSHETFNFDNLHALNISLYHFSKVNESNFMLSDSYACSSTSDLDFIGAYEQKQITGKERKQRKEPFEKSQLNEVFSISNSSFFNNDYSHKSSSHKLVKYIKYNGAKWSKDFNYFSLESDHSCKKGCNSNDNTSKIDFCFANNFYHKNLDFNTGIKALELTELFDSYDMSLYCDPQYFSSFDDTAIGLYAINSNSEFGSSKKFHNFDSWTNSLNSCLKTAESHYIKKKKKSLPSPEKFGGGNPFLIFLCLTFLLQHRDYIMKNKLDYNEIAMFYDRQIRKHNVFQVLQDAQLMFKSYLQEWQRNFITQYSKLDV